MPKAKVQSQSISQISQKSGKKATVKGATKIIAKTSKMVAPPKLKRPSAPPKRPCSAYMYFNMEMLTQMKGMDKFNNLNLGEKAKIVSESWAKLKEEQKDEYVNRSDDDKLRYEKQLKSIEKKGFFINSEGKDSRDLYKAPKQLKPTKVAATNDDDSENNLDDSAQKKRQIKGAKDNGKTTDKDDICRPKRPQASFFQFAMENRPRIYKENPDMKIAEVGKRNGEDWKKLNDAQKKKYVKMFEKDKARYEKEMKEFEENGYFTNSDGVKSTFLNSKHVAQEFEKDTIMPKKVKTGWMFYFMEQQTLMKNDEGKTKVTENTKLISENWAKMTAAKKLKYEKLQQKDSERYNDQLEEIRKNGFFMQDGVKSTELPVKQKRVKRQLAN